MPGSSVITIGNFDGVHLGHQAIVRRAREVAGAGGRVVALTFDPHPASILRPSQTPLRLTTLDERVALLRQAGADEVDVVKPTLDVLGQSPREFIERIMRDHDGRAIVEGPDFRFGKGRAGDTRTLFEIGREVGFDVHIVSGVEAALHDQLVAPVSSSLIRWLLGGGRVSDAARCLGRAHAIVGAVARGEQRGRTIGVPTANIDIASLGDLATPGDGVYAGRVTLLSKEPTASYAAAISVGNKPTFGGEKRLIEAHLLDFAGDLYDQTIEVAFDRWIRDQQPFPTIDALKAQLRRDIDAARSCAARDMATLTSR